MNLASYILATAGHVDHGKSALVRALTGVDPDRLPEEKARGITIELGFAELTLTAGEIEMHLGLVDVPGHEDFVKNMVAGVGSIDAALLVVAANDGWMPQTEEHLQILLYLGVKRGVVALSKADLLDDVSQTMAQVRSRLRGTPLEEAPIVPSSVTDGRGIEALKSAIARVVGESPPQRDLGKPRLSVDRAFGLKGVGTIVTGSLTGGTLHRGQEVIVQPAATLTRIRSIQTHRNEVDRGVPGSRVALNLPDLSPGRDAAAGGVGRGDVVTLPSLGAAVKVVDLLVRRSTRATPGPIIRNGSLVRLHHGSSSSAGRLRLFDQQKLAPGEQSLGRIQLESPMFLLAGDRFVIRDWPQQHTLAGGVVLDVDPPSSRRNPAHQTMLQARAVNPEDVAIYFRSLLTRDRAVQRRTLLQQSRFGAGEIEQAIASAVAAGNAIAFEDLIFDASAHAQLIAAAAAAVDGHHRDHPEQAGMSPAELRHRIGWRSAPPTMADAIIATLCADGFVRRGGAIARASHCPRLPPRLESAGRKLRQTLETHRFDPPARKQLASDDVSMQTLKFLIATAQVIEISPEIVMAAGAYADAAARVRDYLRQHGSATVAQLKELLGSSRRVMVPLVEKLDRDGITRRHGDFRLLREPPPRT